MKSEKTRLAIFDTFKTKKQQITGEAIRQRAIIHHLSNSTNSASKTRTAISQSIAEENNILWKNIYSGIFRDLDEILIPLGIVEEEGRLPLKRGPKALQQNGMPFYHLTKKGMIVSLSIDKISDRKKILKEIVNQAEDENEKQAFEIMEKLVKIAPHFGFSVFERYVKAYCESKIDDLLPFTIQNVSKSADDSAQLQMELLEGFSKLSKSDRDQTIDFLKKID
ncbi:MAG: hypothetical protein HOM82_00705 [Thaumarchaeota archaeon]|nr:hypothetical protein [Nitrososphaerota archaeon]MBT3743486.1 hypothetical protein [Nitrososphaerota archaeon]MBT4057277.1 hypothetical protein [Nitrososphaerota archaeon]MBT4176395.1 hypothetical protein [Nitrososphaerota archaeon]MBT4509330.1 hypothetical protein [Nitrososphaerota archaeon]